MDRNGNATITALGGGRYDIHIDVPWHGIVEVTLPLRNKLDGVLHRIANIWVPEGRHPGEGKVWVNQLSWFSTISSTVAKALCLTLDPKKFVTCLLLKGINAIDKKLAVWIAEKISHSCLAAIVANVAFGRATLPLVLFKDPACVGNAVDGPPVTTSPPPSPAPPSPSPPNPSSPPSPSPQPTPSPSPSPSPPSYAYHVMGTCEDGACGLNVRSGPGYSNYAVVGTLAANAEVNIVCQAAGETVGPSPTTGNSSAIWDKLTSGGWVSDLYISTPNVGTWSPPIPQC